MNRRSQPSIEEKQRFYAAMKPKWDEVATLLAADRPPEWEGYHFEAEIVPGSVPEQFRIRVSFKDRVSNRDRGGAPKKIVDRVADLQMNYVEFWVPMAWKKVIIEQNWDRERKSWGFETKWEY